MHRGVPSVVHRVGLAALGLLALAFVLAASPAAAEKPYKHHRHHGHDDGSCISHCDCPAGELCHSDGSKGTCKPAHCPENWKPVCGLDGQTYGNRCEADAAHIVVAHDGECKEMAGEDEEGKRCGGIQGLPCPEGEICDLPPGLCRGADLQGVCTPRPQACTRDFRPVCGCDGKTYPNDCERLRAGAQKNHDGECGAECKDNAACGDGNYCEFAIGRCAAPGECQVRPEICTFEFQPVCGCDGKTYGNACQAAAAGVSVSSAGECPG